MQRSGVTRLTPGILLLVVVAGAAALFATYWDDAWHTDLGRDDATIPPHPLPCGSVPPLKEQITDLIPLCIEPPPGVGGARAPSRQAGRH
jgi:hypothetical protein